MSTKEAKGRYGRPNLDYDNDLPKYQRVHVITVAHLPLSAALDRTFGSPLLAAIMSSGAGDAKLFARVCLLF